MRKSHLKIVANPRPEKTLYSELDNLRSILKAVLDIIDFKMQQINDLDVKFKQGE